MKNKKRLLLTVASLCVLANSSLYAVDYKEGGYVARNVNPRFVYNFIKHFNYNQYYYSADLMWTYNNNLYVDDMDYAFYGGHGSPFHIYGEHVDLNTAGYNASKGYGDRNLEFVTFYSCKTVPTPIEVNSGAVSSWWRPWINESPNDDIFDGLHMITGFHTNAYIAPSEAVADNFGGRVANNEKIRWAWFNAIWEDGDFSNGLDRASAVYHPSKSEDRYSNALSSDPDEHHQNLAIWYMI